MTEHNKKDQIASLKVSDLFGRFDYCLTFPKKQNISIVTAPNGYGKTVLLRMVDSIFNKNLSFFWRILFKQLEIRFDSGRSLLLYKDYPDLIQDDNLSPPKVVFLKSRGFGHDNETYRFTPEEFLSGIRHFERHLPIDQVGPDRWFDYSQERTISTDEVVQRYADQLPPRVLNLLKLPDWLHAALDCIDAHLVETQRLLYLDEPEERGPRRRPDRTRHASVVERDAEDLAAHIGRLLQQYANESQKLDQTFPKRVLEFQSGPARMEDEIRAQLQELTQKRDDLMSVGLLGSTITEPIQPSDIFKEESIRKILSIYVEDTRKKLSIFDNTYAKIRLFKQILDQHFSFKTITIDPEKGISAIDINSDESIPLSELSSGEQHELVLIYELLFKVKEGATILIDEPELSLHVSWQKRFIADLQKIQELKDMRVVIATHSPQIINDRWDLVQRLKA